MLNGMDLFSGRGGTTLALGGYVVPVMYCENDPINQQGLLCRMRDGQLPLAPIWDNVETLQGWEFRGLVDIILATWPCQGNSTAGSGKGSSDPRSGLLKEVLRLAQEVRPSYLFFENVPGVRNKQLDELGKGLAAIGYNTEWDIVSAREVGADHLRKRFFALSHINKDGFSKEADAASEENLERLRKDYRRASPTAYICNRRAYPPALCRNPDDVSDRMDRVAAMGEAVVPIQAREAFERLMGFKEV